MKIGIIGCGAMGGAIASALVRSGLHEVVSTDHTKAKVEDAGATFVPTIEEVLEAGTIILAVKPQSFSALMPTLRKAEGRRWISLSPCHTTASLTESLGTGEVIRMNPSLAARVGASVTALCPAPLCGEPFLRDALAIARSFGSAFVLRESEMAPFIGISGSGIAFIFHFLHAMALGGTREGIPYGKSLEIARETMESAVRLQRETGRNPIDLMTGVCSAGGTTIEGISALEEGGFTHAVMEAVTASSEKSKQMR